jgi:hypothetical protein
MFTKNPEKKQDIPAFIRQPGTYTKTLHNYGENSL